MQLTNKYIKDGFKRGNKFLVEGGSKITILRTFYVQSTIWVRVLFDDGHTATMRLNTLLRDYGTAKKLGKIRTYFVGAVS